MLRKKQRRQREGVRHGNQQEGQTESKTPCGSGVQEGIEAGRAEDRQTSAAQMSLGPTILLPRGWGSTGQQRTAEVAPWLLRQHRLVLRSPGKVGEGDFEQVALPWPQVPLL